MTLGGKAFARASLPQRQRRRIGRADPSHIIDLPIANVPVGPECRSATGDSQRGAKRLAVLKCAARAARQMPSWPVKP